jgi:type VI secretion system protein ImpG
MQDDLRRYYNDELSYIRQLGTQFAREYPGIALGLEQDPCPDPHVERLLEGFAFLAARVRKKIDDEFHEITEALLNVVYPHFLRPIPSFTVLQFELDPDQGRLSSGLVIDRHTVLESRPLASNRSPREFQAGGDERCKFRTVYPTTLWPITVTSAEWTTPDRIPGLRSPESVAAVRVQLACTPNTRFSQLQIDELCFYLDGERRLVHKLYELLCSRLNRIVVRDPTPRSNIEAQPLPPSALHPMGFGEDEGALPYPGRSFIGYRVLQEYFAFPEKFFFIKIAGLKSVWNATGRRQDATFGQTAELVFLFSSFEGADRTMLQIGVGAETFKLGCTPVINLFPHVAESILLDQTKDEYPIVPDVRRPNSFEVFSVDEVYAITPQTREAVRCEPFFAFRHSEDGNSQQMFWLGHRNLSIGSEDSGTDMTISLLDLSTNPIDPDADLLDVRTTCTNRDLPSRLPFRIGKEAIKDDRPPKGDLRLDETSAVNAVILLTKPTPARRISLTGDAQWRLVSHLTLNYLSLIEDGGAGLKQMLMLYNFDRSSTLEKHISGIVGLKNEREFAPVAADEGITLARGVRIDIEFDEDQFVGGGVYLFASVLEQFLGMYASLNSFTRLRATTIQRKEVLREWPPRAGQRILV